MTGYQEVDMDYPSMCGRCTGRLVTIADQRVCNRCGWNFDKAQEQARLANLKKSKKA
jgi:hypothetical protein